jgi:hypothetical protein
MVSLSHAICHLPSSKQSIARKRDEKALPPATLRDRFTHELSFVGHIFKGHRELAPHYKLVDQKRIFELLYVVQTTRHQFSQRVIVRRMHSRRYREKAMITMLSLVMMLLAAWFRQFIVSLLYPCNVISNYPYILSTKATSIHNEDLPNSRNPLRHCCFGRPRLQHFLHWRLVLCHLATTAQCHAHCLPGPHWCFELANGKHGQVRSLLACCVRSQDCAWRGQTQQDPRKGHLVAQSIHW